MPSVGVTRSMINHHSYLDDKRCSCCPYGYHIDIGFVPFTMDMLSNKREGAYKRLQELKDKWRCERQSMDKLLGVPPRSTQTLAKFTKPNKWCHSWEFAYPESATVTLSDRLFDGLSNFGLPIGNDFAEAVSDFEEALLRTQPQARILSYDIPDSQKYHTFPRIKAPVQRDIDIGTNLLGSNQQLSKGSSTASSTTTSTVIMKESNSKRPSMRDLSKFDRKIVSENLCDLQSTYIQDRESNQIQDLALVNRLQDLEEKVKLIPELEGKVSELKEEKQHLIKLLDDEKKTKPKVFNNSSSNITANRTLLITESDKDIKSTKSTDSLIELKSPTRRKSRDAAVGVTILTREVGVSHSPRTRTIGVGGIAESASSWERGVGDAHSPTGSLSGTLRRRIRSFETGVQVNDHDLMGDAPSIPILQIVEKSDVGVQTVTSNQASPLLGQKSSQTYIYTKSVGVTAKPSLRDFGLMFKPSSQDSASNTVQEANVGNVESVSIEKNSAIPDTPCGKPLSIFKSDAMKLETSRLNHKTIQSNPNCQDSAKNTVQEHHQPGVGNVENISIAKNSAVPDTPSGRPISIFKSIAMKVEASRQNHKTMQSNKEVSEKITQLKAFPTHGVISDTVIERNPSTRDFTFHSTYNPASLINAAMTPEAVRDEIYARKSQAKEIPVSSEKVKVRSPQYPRRFKSEAAPPEDCERMTALKSLFSLNLSSNQVTSKPKMSWPQSSSTATTSQPSEAKVISKIPRLTSPHISPASSPRATSKPIAIASSAPAPQTSYSPIDDSESSSSSSVSPTTANIVCKSASEPSVPTQVTKRPGFFRSDTYTKEMHAQSEKLQSNVLEPLEEEERERPALASASFGFGLSQENREKAVPTREMQAALKVLNDALLRGRTTMEVTTAISIILHEWFRIAGTKTAIPLDVEDYLDVFEGYSPQLLRYIVNMPDGNGNTAMHYAVSHGNFDVVSILLDSKVCDPNKANKAGYTSVMLVSLAKVLSETHRQVVRRLFGLGDVNIKAAQHGQTALMLGASHGRLDTVRLLLEAGADINIQDEDGSTALMCASEHGHGEIVKYLLAQSECDPHMTDNDGSTALTVAMEAGHKDIGVMLYAHMHFVKAPPSPFASGLRRSRSSTPRSTPSSKSNSPITSAQTSPVATKKQHPSFSMQ